MSYAVCYWDDVLGIQAERLATAEESARIDSLKSVKNIPQTVPMRSARLILLREGLLSSVQSHIDNMVGIDAEEAKINWEFALTVQRDDPLVKQLIPSLGKTEAQIDQMFIEASQL